MAFLLPWSRRRRSSLPPSSLNDASTTTPLPTTEATHEVIPRTNGRAISCQRFRLRWVDDRCQECAVCYSKFQMNCVVALLPCGHYYCHACMDQWFYCSTSSKCPLCRYDCSQPVKEEQEVYGNFYSMVLPTAVRVGDSSSSSTDDCSSSSSEEGEGRDRDPEGLVCCYQGDPRATVSTMAGTARTSLLVDENDPLVSLVERYAQGENFHLILSKALKAKQAWERHAAYASTTPSPTTVSSTI